MRTYIDDVLKNRKKMCTDMRSPYTPGAGNKPDFLAGRDALISDITNCLDDIKDGGMARHHIFYGVRGVGKTVLLNKIEEIADDNDILYVHLECSDINSFLREILNTTQNYLQKISTYEAFKDKVNGLLQIIKNINLECNLSERTISASLTNQVINRNLTCDLTELIVNFGKILNKQGKVFIFFIDELQMAKKEHLAAFIAAIHRTNQLSLPIMVIGAGLPTVSRIVSEAKSYAEKLFTGVKISYLKEKDAISALVEPAQKKGVSYEDKAVAEVIKHTEGYPYFIQMFGDCIWKIKESNSIGIECVLKALDRYIEILDDSFFGSRYSRATNKEKEFLFAMMKCGIFPCSITDIANKLNKGIKTISPLRSHLINKGLIYSPSFGEVDFTVPHFDKYLQRLQKQSFVGSSINPINGTPV